MNEEIRAAIHELLDACIDNNKTQLEVDDYQIALYLYVDLGGARTYRIKLSATNPREIQVLIEKAKNWKG